MLGIESICVVYFSFECVRIKQQQRCVPILSMKLVFKCRGRNWVTATVGCQLRTSRNPKDRNGIGDEACIPIQIVADVHTFHTDGISRPRRNWLVVALSSYDDRGTGIKYRSLGGLVDGCIGEDGKVMVSAESFIFDYLW